MANVPVIADLKTAEAIVDAARSGKMSKLYNLIGSTSEGERVALGKKICAELCHKDEDNPFYNAARLRNSEMCDILLHDFKLDPNFGTPSGKAPLCFAAYFGDIFVMEGLIGSRANVHFADANGFSPIHYAVLGDQAGAIRKLMSKGAEVGANGPAELSPLLLATLLGHTSCLQLLLTHPNSNANPNELLGGAVPPIVLALMNNENCKFHPLHKTREILELLIQAGVQVANIPVLSLAYHSMDLMQFLLDAGANPNLPNESGRLPIEVAAMRGKREVVAMLYHRTNPIPSVQDWTVDGLIAKCTSEKFENEMRVMYLRQRIAEMFSQEKYATALAFCNYAIEENPDNVNIYYAKRSYCWKNLGYALNELFLNNATEDAGMIGMSAMSQVVQMISKDQLAVMKSFQIYLNMIFE